MAPEHRHPADPSKGVPPRQPLGLLIHISSVWCPGGRRPGLPPVTCTSCVHVRKPSLFESNLLISTVLFLLKDGVKIQWFGETLVRLKEPQYGYLSLVKQIRPQRSVIDPGSPVQLSQCYLGRREGPSKTWPAKWSELGGVHRALSRCSVPPYVTPLCHPLCLSQYSEEKKEPWVCNSAWRKRTEAPIPQSSGPQFLTLFILC